MAVENPATAMPATPPSHSICVEDTDKGKRKEMSCLKIVLVVVHVAPNTQTVSGHMAAWVQPVEQKNVRLVVLLRQ